MADNITLKLETKRFETTLRRYAASSKRTVREVINRAALNVAFEAMDLTKRANADDIKRLGTKSDPKRLVWYKYIAKVISQTGYIIKKNRFKTVTVDGKKKRVLSHTEEKGIHGRYTVEQARMVSDKIKASRLRGIGYVASGFLPAVEHFWRRVKDKPFRRGRAPKQYGAPNGIAREGGSEWNPLAHFENRATGSVKVATAALQSAFRKVGIDMADYLQKKMKRNAQEASSGR